MTQEKHNNIKPEHNVQIPIQVLLHPEIDVYSLKVFSYMKFRYQFFQGTLKTTYRESNSTISEAIGISRSKVIESINKLELLGFITRESRHGKGSSKKEQTNIYIISDILTPNGVITFREKKVKKVDTKQEVVYIQPQYTTVDEGDDCPF